MAARPNNIQEAIQAAAQQFAHDVRSLLDDGQLRQIAMSGLASDFAGRSQSVQSYVHFAMALSHDDEVRSLLKPEGKEAPILYSLIAGTELWAMQLPARVLAGCLFEHLIEGIPWTEESIAEGLLRNVERLRRVAKGLTVETAWAAGFAGFTLEPGIAVETKLGHFSDPGPRGDIFSEDLLPASIVVTAPLRHHIPVDRRDRKPPLGSDQAALNEAIRKSTLIQLAVIMAASKDTLVVPVHTRQTVAEPHLGWMGFFRPPSGGDVMVTSAVLDSAETLELVRWAEILSGADVASIQVALDRLTTAVTERRRPADMLIDAVTSWESLFGATPETTFRVTAALAVFLEPGFGDRMARRKELDEIYRIRSRIVHGESVDSKVTQKSADTAIEVSKAAIRRILVQNHWLLSLKGSRERSDAVLLGDPRLTFSST
jgi:hypothetical protein